MVLRSPNIAEFDELKKQVEELSEQIALVSKENKDLKKLIEDHINITDIHTKRYPM